MKAAGRISDHSKKCAWTVDPAIPFDASWHGACVVSRADGMLLGLLVVDDEPLRVALVK